MRPSFAAPSLATLCAWFAPIGLDAGARAQAVANAGTYEPYTGGRAESLAKLDYVSFGPFPLGKGHGSAEVDGLVGEGRMLWVETAHFRIGCGLDRRDLPEKGRKGLYEACKRLQRKLPAFAAEPPRLDEWLQLHLLALRAEETFAEFTKLLGVGPEWFAANPVGGRGDGPYLGCREKFVLLVFQRESDLGRYLRSFCDTQDASPCQHRWMAPDAFVFATAAACCGGLLEDTALMQAHVVRNLAQNLVDAVAVRRSVVPWWWRDGVGNWFARKVDPRLVDLGDDPERLESRELWEWGERARTRTRQGHMPDQRELFTWYDGRGRPIADSVAAWSLVDFLIARRNDGFGRFMLEVRARPMRSIYAPPDLVMRWHAVAFETAFGMELASVEAHWRKAALAGGR